MKQVNVPLRAKTMSPVFELPATIPELPPTVERDAGGEHVVGGVSGKKDGESIPRDDLIVTQNTAPSTPPSKAAQGETLDPYRHCAAHRLCRSMGDQTSQFVMIDKNCAVIGCV